MLALHLSRPRPAAVIGAGVALGALALTRPGFLYLALPMAVALALFELSRERSARAVLAPAFFLGAFALVLTPWLLRNGLVLGRAGLTADYGAQVLVERLAFNAMTGREFMASFLYCLPDFGDSAARALFGREAVERFSWTEDGGFFQTGLKRRIEMIGRHGGLDDMLPALLRTEVLGNWANHLKATVSLSWCGLWVSRYWGLFGVLCFVGAAWAALRQRRYEVLVYAFPAFFMLGLQAAVSVNQPRYNMALIAPFSVAGAWALQRALGRSNPHAEAPSRPRGLQPGEAVRP